MDAKLLEFAESKNFTAEKNFVYGLIDDVYVTITPTGGMLQFYFSMSCAVPKAKDAIKQALRQIGGIRSPEIRQKGEAVIVLLSKTAKLLEYEMLDNVVNTVIRSAKEMNVVPNVTCVQCGRKTDEMAILRQAACPVCAGCVSELEDNNESYTSSPWSYITGIIGALIGALIGAVPWIIIYHFGLILSILAVLIPIGAFFGYRLFRGPRKRGSACLIIYIISILVAAANFIIYMFIMFSYKGYDALSLQNYIDILSDYETLASVLIAFAFAIIGIIGIHGQVLAYSLPRNAKPIGRRPGDPQYPEYDDRQSMEEESGSNTIPE